MIHSFVKREEDYAIRICAFLSSDYPNGHKTIKEIASYLALTKPIASKIIHKLIKGKILQSVRGRNGGISIIDNPQTTSFYNILVATGFNSTLNECLNNPSVCPLVSFCKIHLFWKKIEQDIISTLSNTYIADFMFNKTDLNKKGEKSGSFTV